MLSVAMLSVIMLSVTYKPVYAQCRYAECRGAFNSLDRLRIQGLYCKTFYGRKKFYNIWPGACAVKLYRVVYCQYCRNLSQNLRVIRQ